MKPYLISWKSGLRRGKIIILELNPVQAWEKLVAKWNKDFKSGEIDIGLDEVEQFSVELAADEFVE